MQKPLAAFGPVVVSFGRLPTRTHVILALLAPATACGGDPSKTGDVPPQTEDSAGVRIVAYEGTPTAEPAFRFPAEPRYRHGATPGDYTFRGINVGRLFPDGSAVVSDEWNSELVVLSPDGTTHEVLARQGEGPGEVMYVYDMFALGQDSVLMADPRLGRVTLFAGRSVARTVDQPASFNAASVWRESVHPASCCWPPEYLPSACPNSKGNGSPGTWPVSTWRPAPSTRSRRTTTCRVSRRGWSGPRSRRLAR